MSVLLVTLASAVALSAAVGAAALNSPGPGMMGGAVGGARGGGSGAAGLGKPTVGELGNVRARINAWLATSGFRGFSVAEVMAFTNNDYIAVHDARGMPAFELLTSLRTTWVMEEPPSMMWNTRYGVMGDFGSGVTPMMGGSMMGGSWSSWSGAGTGKVASTADAVEIANRWLAKADPGERVAADAGGSAMGKFPGYYTFDTTRAGNTYGMLSVNASTGVVWYHGWHGKFLAERDF
jgi:hypothetical protein